MKVVEYWHETIKNYRYDEDVSLCRGCLANYCFYDYRYRLEIK